LRLLLLRIACNFVDFIIKVNMAAIVGMPATAGKFAVRLLISKPQELVCELPAPVNEFIMPPILKLEL
jgi:hypothetical protein